VEYGEKNVMGAWSCFIPELGTRLSTWGPGC
jgi:hypothetical protein